MTHFVKRILGVLLLLAIPAAPAFAKSAPNSEAANAWAEVRGKEMYLHDQAAWHGTDALRKEIDFADHPELRGYVVDPLENGNLALVFFAEDDQGLYEFARYEVAGSKVVGGGVIEGEDRTRLSTELDALTRAKHLAIDEIVRREWGLCTQSSPNFVILPADADGTITVYALSSTTDAAMIPFGGHYRVQVRADGSIQSARKFTNSCLNMRTVGPDGAAPVSTGVTHSLDDHPTEIHYFQSYYMPGDVMVLTEDRIWTISKGVFKGEDSGPVN